MNENNISCSITIDLHVKLNNLLPTPQRITIRKFKEITTAMTAQLAFENPPCNTPPPDTIHHPSHLRHYIVPVVAVRTPKEYGNNAAVGIDNKLGMSI